MKESNLTSLIKTNIFISAAVLILFVFASFFVSPLRNETLIVLLCLILCLPIFFSTFLIYKEEYQKNTQLIVPKVFGFGVGINPNHPLGKVIWALIGLLLTFLTIYLICQL